MIVRTWLSDPQLWRRLRHGLMKKLRSTVFPASCIGCGCSEAALCIDCAPLVSERAVVRVATAALAVATLGIYRQTLRDAILALKDGRRDIAEVLSELMAYRLGQLLPDSVGAVAEGAKLCLVGVPTTASRRRERGVDGGPFLAEALGVWWGVPAFPVLQQIAGDTQRGRGRKARLEAKGRFRLASPGPLQGYSVLLVDDVTTTGATLADIAGMLHTAEVPVLAALAIARVEETTEPLSPARLGPVVPLPLELLG